MIDKSQSKTLADFLVNIATAWFVAAVVAPFFSVSSSTPVRMIILGIFFGSVSLSLALIASKE